MPAVETYRKRNAIHGLQWSFNCHTSFLQSGIELFSLSLVNGRVALESFELSNEPGNIRLGHLDTLKGRLELVECNLSSDELKNERQPVARQFWRLLCISVLVG